MAPDSIMVVEDGVDERSPQSRGRSLWLLVAVSFGLGVVVGVLATAPLEPTASPEPTATVPTGDTTPSPDPASGDTGGIASVIPTFPDAIVAVGDGVGGGLQHLLWPPDEALVVRGMTEGGDVRFDATGQFIAMTESIPDLPGVLLSMGRFSAIRPVRSEVTSFAWHDSRSGEMAYTTEQEGGWQLHRAARTLAPSLVLEDRFRGGSIAAWGDWGYAIQAGEDEVALVNADGAFKDLEPGRALTSHESGWVFIADDDFKLVSSGGGVRRLMPLEDDRDAIVAAEFSPDATKVAIAGRSGVAVLNIADSELRDLSPDFPAQWVAWSSDSRYVIAPARSGMFIHDLESGRARHVLAGRSVIVATVFPAAAS